MIINTLFFLGDECLMSIYSESWPPFVQGQTIFLEREVILDDTNDNEFKCYKIRKINHRVSYSNTLGKICTSARMEVLVEEA